MVVIKIAAVLFSSLVRPTQSNRSTGILFMPNGFSGVLTGSAIVFFTYIGFDSVSTAAEETRNPQRDMPIGIIGTLILCAILYGSVALVLTGIVDRRTLNNAAPVANALKAIGLNNLRFVVTTGALLGMLSLFARLSIWAGAHLVRYVARPPASGPVFSGSPALSYTSYQHLDSGTVCGDSGRNLGYRHLCRARKYRYALCLRACVHRRHSLATFATRPAARLSRTLGTSHTHFVSPFLLSVDAQSAVTNFCTICRLASGWSGHLFRL